MLVVAGTITLDPVDIEAIRAAATAMIEATNQEPGCRHYDFAVSMTDPSVVQIFEVWDSEADLRAHFDSDHMAVWREALGTTGVRDRELYRYEIESFEPLG